MLLIDAVMHSIGNRNGVLGKMGSEREQGVK